MPAELVEVVLQVFAVQAEAFVERCLRLAKRLDGQDLRDPFQPVSRRGGGHRRHTTAAAAAAAACDCRCRLVPLRSSFCGPSSSLPLAVALGDDGRQMRAKFAYGEIAKNLQGLSTQVHE